MKNRSVFRRGWLAALFSICIPLTGMTKLCCDEKNGLTLQSGAIAQNDTAAQPEPGPVSL